MILIVVNGKPASAVVGVSVGVDGMIQLSTLTDSWSICKFTETEGKLRLNLMTDISDPLVSTDCLGRIKLV